MARVTGVTGLALLFLVVAKCPSAQGEPKTGAPPETRAAASQPAAADAAPSPLAPPRPGRRVIVYMGNRPWFSSMYGTADASRTEYIVPSVAKSSAAETTRTRDLPTLSTKESGQTAGVGAAAKAKPNKLSSVSLLAAETTSNEASADDERVDLAGELDVNKHPPPPLPPFRGPKIEFHTRTVHEPSTASRNEDDNAASGGNNDFQPDQTAGRADDTPSAVVGANRRAALQEANPRRPTSSFAISTERQQELADRNLNSRYFSFGPGTSTGNEGSARSANLFAKAANVDDSREGSREDDPVQFRGGNNRFNQQRQTFGSNQDSRRPALPPLPSLPPPPPPPPPPSPTTAPPTASSPLGTTRYHFTFQPDPAIFGNNSGVANRGDFQFETSHARDTSSQQDTDGRSDFNSAEQRSTPPATSQQFRQFPTPPASRPASAVTPSQPRQAVSAQRPFPTFSNLRQATGSANTDSTSAPTSAGQTLRFNFRESKPARASPAPRPLQNPVTNSFVTYFPSSDLKQSQKSAELSDGTGRRQDGQGQNFRTSNTFNTAPLRPPPQRPSSTSFFQGPQAQGANPSNNFGSDASSSRDFSAPAARSNQGFRQNVFPVDPPANSFLSNQRSQSGFTSSPRSQEDFSSSPRSQAGFTTSPRSQGFSSNPKSQSGFNSNSRSQEDFSSNPRSQNGFTASPRPQDFSSNTRSQNGFTSNPRSREDFSTSPRSQNSFSPSNDRPSLNFQTSQAPRSNFPTPRPLNSFSSNSRQQDSFSNSPRGQNNGQSDSRVQDSRFQSFGRSQDNFQTNDRPQSSFSGNRPSSPAPPPPPRPQNGFAVNQRSSDPFQGNQRDRNTFSANQQRPQNSFSGSDQSARDRGQTNQRLQELPRGRQQNTFQNAPPARPQTPSAPPAVRNPPQSNDNASPSQGGLEPFRNDFQIALRQRAFSATTASPVDGNDGRTPAAQGFKSTSGNDGGTKRKINRVVFIPGNFGVTPTRRPDPYRSKLPGLAGSDYPTYSEVPFTNFKCNEQSSSGMFADVEAGCQVFHSCDNNNRQKSFLCPNGTIFKQELFTCDWWYNVDCDSSPKFFHLNIEMYTTTPRPKARDNEDEDRRNVDSRSDSGRPRSF